MTIARIKLAQTNFDDIAKLGLLAPVMPGEILREEFMLPLGLSARALARDIGVPPNRITDIIHGARGITAHTALKLAARFNNSARFWMNLQVGYDLAVAEQELGLVA